MKRVVKVKHESKALQLVKKTAKRIQKKNPHIPNNEILNDLAKHLGFDDFAHLRRVSPEKLEAALKEKDVSKL